MTQMLEDRVTLLRTAADKVARFGRAKRWLDHHGDDDFKDGDPSFLNTISATISWPYGAQAQGYADISAVVAGFVGANLGNLIALAVDYLRIEANEALAAVGIKDLL